MTDDFSLCWQTPNMIVYILLFVQRHKTNKSEKRIKKALRINVFSETYTKGGILVCVFQEDKEL